MLPSTQEGCDGRRHDPMAAFSSKVILPVVRTGAGLLVGSQKVVPPDGKW